MNSVLDYKTAIG